MNAIEYYSEQPDHERIKAIKRLNSFIVEIKYAVCSDDGELDSDLFTLPKEELIEYICTGYINEQALRKHVKILQDQVDHLQLNAHILSCDKAKSPVL